MQSHKGHTNGVGPSWVVKYNLWPQGPFTHPSKSHDEIYRHKALSRRDADLKFLSDCVRVIPHHCKLQNESVFFWITFAWLNHVILRSVGWWMYWRPLRMLLNKINKCFNM